MKPIPRLPEAVPTFLNLNLPAIQTLHETHSIHLEWTTPHDIPGMAHDTVHHRLHPDLLDRYRLFRHETSLQGRGIREAIGTHGCRYQPGTQANS